jgi:hypothetical protein
VHLRNYRLRSFRYLGNHTATICAISPKWINSNLYTTEATNMQTTLSLELAYEKPQLFAFLSTTADNISLDVE